MIECPSCGRKHRPGTLFCSECGMYLPTGGPLRTEPLPEGGFAAAGRDYSGTGTTQYGSRAPSLDAGTARYSLERDYQSRQRGYDRYQRHQSSAGRMSRGRAGYGRRGRR